MTKLLTWHAWLELLRYDVVGMRGFRAVKELVVATPVRTGGHSQRPATIEATVTALEVAGRLYVKRPQCLQRSTVVTRLLRKNGINARLVIGCHLAPVRAHAWVEVAGDVVSDAVDDLPYFCILDRW